MLPLPGDVAHTVIDALKYLYRRTFGRHPVKFASPIEAVMVASFAHKYDCANLTHEADLYLATQATDKSGLLLFPQSSRTAKAGEPQDHSPMDIPDFTALAENAGLPRLLCSCIHWLASHEKAVHEASERVAGLAPSTLASLTRALAVAMYQTRVRTYQSGTIKPSYDVPSLPTILKWHGLT